MRFAPLLLALSLLLPLGIAAADETQAPLAKTPMMYVAVGSDATLFLQGTLHIPDTRITTLSPIEIAALDRADELWAEADFSEDVRAQLMPYVRLPRNRDLSSLLGEKLEARVEAILKRRGESLRAWRGMKPFVLDVYLGQLFAPKETATQTTLDEILFAEMAKRGKPVGGLESVFEQVQVFDRMKLPQQVELLRETVARLERDVEKGTNSIETMIKIYLSGDDEELLTEVETYFDFDTKRDRDLYVEMHAKRNQRMVERLEAKAKETPGKVRYVAVGGAHLAGKQGIVKLLERSGYVVWRVAAPEDVPASREASLGRALAELKRQNAGLSQSLRSLEDQVLRLRDRMDKRESKDAARDRRGARPSTSGGDRCRPRRRKRCCIPRPPCPPIPRCCPSR
ncbi:MAG: TraB/GumN family protein [Planctomycetota bacterium]|nr:TraB/GumN family protein [Planctomycetota bacterium]